jgi:ABC-2 type transport system ATP-binding protein
VDPRARRLFWDLIHSLSRDGGITVIVSTHYMDEAEHCDRLGLMHQGRLIADGSPVELKERSRHRSGSVLAIRTADSRTAYHTLRREHPQVVLYGDHIRMRTVDPDGDHVTLARVLAQAGVGRIRIEPVPISMDEAFTDFIQTAEARHG